MQALGAAMRRREFISLIAGATAWPLGARAQQPALGFLNAAAAVDWVLAAFQRGLAEQGYVTGKNLAIEYRHANYRPELLREAARDVVRLNVNVIFAANPEALAEARNATSTIPIVGIDLEHDPVAMRYAKSLTRLRLRPTRCIVPAGTGID
jgi:putative ABC transport system substrate-binding protein